MESLLVGVGVGLRIVPQFFCICLSLPKMLIFLRVLDSLPSTLLESNQGQGFTDKCFEN